MSLDKRFAGPEVVYAYTPPVSTYVDISTCNSTFAASVYIFTDAQSPSSFSCSNRNGTCDASAAMPWANAMSNVRMFGGLRYFIAIEGPANILGNYAMTITESMALQSA